MKKIVFIGLIVVFLASSLATTVVKANHVIVKSKTEKKVGPDCRVQYERKCNFGQQLNIIPGTITNTTDVSNYCTQTSISCSPTECEARLNVMFGFLPGSPKNDSCLPAGYRGK